MAEPQENAAAEAKEEEAKQMPEAPPAAEAAPAAEADAAAEAAERAQEEETRRAAERVLAKNEEWKQAKARAEAERPPPPPPQAEAEPYFVEDEETQQIHLIIASVTQHASTAMAYRKKNEMRKAIKHMERALRECEGHEQGHPALAVEAARARLNLGAMLAAADRHLEALIAIKEAQRGLMSVMAWAGDCGPEDPGVESISAEARALHCAAMVAEAIELETHGNEETLNRPWPPPEMQGLHTQIYSEAKALAEDSLPPQHPVASLARRLHQESARDAVCALGFEASAGSKTSSGAKQLPSLEFAAAGAKAKAPKQVVVARSGPDSDAEDEDPLPREAASGEGSPRGMDMVPTKTKKKKGRNKAVLNIKKGEKVDIFTDYLRTIEADKLNKRSSLTDSLDYDKKRITQVHRSTQLALDLGGDDELKDRRYGKQGHKVMMTTLAQENKSRSDPTLVKQAKAHRTTPEVAHLQRIRQQMSTKPSTPQDEGRRGRTSKEPAYN